MKYLKNEDGSTIIKWNDESSLATKTKILFAPDSKESIGIKIRTEIPFTEAEAKGYIEIEQSEYDQIRNGKMTDYWNETAS